ncbi:MULTISPECIES: GNAT family N-acetyltransferase [unclassified Pseudoalteromonas]|uniref:GNAT family N-acetyltransferase n=1 Tax=unclassified Pseudoalteromonas TaxID=194690 RepID=UPI001F35E458|nr:MULTISPECIES: GNAT family N-acetyltransferase [unclassified Pseudoalteromonas]MCF2825971.1 N-acetyltransferase family protein [Pseudoalteromonas sp. OF5H-5]MCF2829993.1 N-acetyltransferase family protein [Pseudoalteromonas sp. DL2-H6]MCF2925370.1 N-acetyltransferase family protein [Pseudoalteromonas sp. DL2-H1]
MNIRLAKPHDLCAIVAIYNETIPSRQVTADTELVSVAQKQSWFAAHTQNRPIYVVELAEKVIAWISFSSFYGRPAYDGTAEVSIYLAKAAQGQGLGSKLMDFAEQQAPSLFITTLLGFIFSHNLPSIRLFEKHGYKKWGELPNVAVMDGNHYSLTILGKSLA